MIDHEVVDELEGIDQVLSIHDIFNAESISWDIFNNRFYWVDKLKRKIFSRREDEIGAERVALLYGKLAAKDIAIYDIGELIFWTSYDTDDICYAHLTATGTGSGKNCFKPQDFS